MLRGMSSTMSLLACARTDVTLDRVMTLVRQQTAESLTLEYKEKFSQQLVKSVAAMANTYGGLIIVGVSDRPGDDRVVGASADTVEKIVNSCFENLEPPFEPEIIDLPLPGQTSGSVIVVRVHPDRAPRPVMIDGRAPVRLHGRNAVADRARLRQLFDETRSPVRPDGGIPAPDLANGGPGQPRTAVLLRSGLRVPMGEAMRWRALSEQATATLAGILDASPLSDAVTTWCADLDLPTPNGFRLAGHNRSRRLRLLAASCAGRREVRVVAELQLPAPDLTPPSDLLFTLDLSARLNPEPGPPIDPGTFTTLDLLAASTPNPRGALLQPPEGRAPGDWPLRIPVHRLRDLFDATLATLSDHDVATALAAIADVDPVLVPWPRTAALRSAATVGELLDEPALNPIPEAGNSYGADLMANPGLDVRDPEHRAEQVRHWLEQIALDAGLSGMQRILNPS